METSNLSDGPVLQVEEIGTGPAILCLHGVGGCGAWFSGLARRLQDRFRVLSLDLPGTGANRQACTPFSIEGCARVLVAYLAAREEAPEAGAAPVSESPAGPVPGPTARPVAGPPAAPVALLGHSMGAIIGLHMAALAPSRLGAFLSVGGLPAVTDATRARLSERIPLVGKNGMDGLGWKVALANFSKDCAARSPETLALFARLWESQDPKAYLEGLAALLGAGAESLAAHVKMPCLALRGKEDGYAPAAESRRFAATLPGPVRFVEMEGCAHMPFLEAPAAFAETVADFLGDPS
jgi:3-oxoadipate enol-lactonase